MRLRKGQASRLMRRAILAGGGDGGGGSTGAAGTRRRRWTALRSQRFERAAPRLGLPRTWARAAGCVLHYDANRGLLVNGGLVVVDIGARWGYCGSPGADVSVNSRFTPRQRQLRCGLCGLEAAPALAGSTIAAAREAFEVLGKAVSGRWREDPGGSSFTEIGHFLAWSARCRRRTQPWCRGWS
jgi:hypothetical protein